VGGKGGAGGGGKGGEMTQTLYAHMNKRKKKEKVPMRGQQFALLFFFSPSQLARALDLEIKATC
jgi:hypothetical protein